MAALVLVLVAVAVMVAVAVAVVSVVSVVAVVAMVMVMLWQVPGFAVSRMGSFGSTTQVRVRGAEGNHLLVMIDGVEASEASTGEFDFGSLLVDDIERIEMEADPRHG